MSFHDHAQRIIPNETLYQRMTGGELGRSKSVPVGSFPGDNLACINGIRAPCVGTSICTGGEEKKVLRRCFHEQQTEVSISEYVAAISFARELVAPRPEGNSTDLIK